MICTVTGVVFIALRLTYPLGKIPLMPPNCPKYRIFHGLLGNIESTNSQWITASPICGSYSSSRSFATRCPRPWIRLWTFAERVRHSSSAWFPPVLEPLLRILCDQAGRRLTVSTMGGTFVDDTSLRSLRFDVFALDRRRLVANQHLRTAPKVASPAVLLFYPFSGHHCCGLVQFGSEMIEVWLRS